MPAFSWLRDDSRPVMLSLQKIRITQIYTVSSAEFDEKPPFFALQFGKHKNVLIELRF